MAFTFDAESPDTGEYFRFKVVPGKTLDLGNGYDDGMVSTMRVIGSKALSQRDQIRAIHAEMNGSSCTHSWDCCGCANTYSIIRPVKPGVFWVRSRTSYNY